MKIDIVYTWVDGSDPLLNKKRIDYSKLTGNIIPDSNNHARFMDNDELKYSLRSINLFAPWVNNIFIVTDNQVPKWLNLSHPKINIINHSEIFSDASFLPSFSARGIESQLHHIKGLSEHFIYFNDDMFLGNTCTPNYFFTNSKLPRIYVSEIIPIPNKKYFDISKHKNDHQRAILNTRMLIKSKFNKSVYYNIRHIAKPLVKSVLFEIESHFEKELDRTCKNRFRTNEDILIFHLFGLYAITKNVGKAKYLKRIGSNSRNLHFSPHFKKNFTFCYINLHEEDIEEKLINIKEKHPFLICLNQTPSTPPKNINLIRNFLPDLYPHKSPFEKDH